MDPAVLVSSALSFVLYLNSLDADFAYDDRYVKFAAGACFHHFLCCLHFTTVHMCIGSINRILR